MFVVYICQGNGPWKKLSPAFTSREDAERVASCYDSIYCTTKIEPEGPTEKSVGLIGADFSSFAASCQAKKFF